MQTRIEWHDYKKNKCVLLREQKDQKFIVLNKDAAGGDYYLDESLSPNSHLDILFHIVLFASSMKSSRVKGSRMAGSIM